MPCCTLRVSRQLREPMHRPRPTLQRTCAAPPCGIAMGACAMTAHASPAGGEAARR